MFPYLTQRKIFEFHTKCGNTDLGTRPAPGTTWSRDGRRGWAMSWVYKESTIQHQTTTIQHPTANIHEDGEEFTHVQNGKCNGALAVLALTLHWPLKYGLTTNASGSFQRRPQAQGRKPTCHRMARHGRVRNNVEINNAFPSIYVPNKMLSYPSNIVRISRTCPSSIMHEDKVVSKVQWVRFRQERLSHRSNDRYKVQ